ncbi:spermatogenesis-associated protein 7 homolog isoform X2 [Parambassis ranga]|uniref:Spermatogenesis-associated protein 7 homolog isoform X1 n=1 Tax=Parambassis ranga TaxID=210632 RepID=A0A6P7HRE4_9TELE|nr:spermatogenesis-associated protein 7 homolog isoform X1 [Parambassis ranga]XP_028251440.1 spermatogenesis-associated protein 7 homolog isoform X2 [Parambassis ranga]
MGYADCNITMESRIGTVSSGLGGSPGARRKTPKSSPFCPRSSSKLTQSIIKDHMVSHYKKVYSAKAAIDASVPKSLLYSVKYNDQLRQGQPRKGGRPQSAHSLSQRNCRTSCSSAQSRLSVQYDDSPYLSSRSSVVSSPRFSTSFNANEIVYPSYKVSCHHTRPASETKYRNPDATLQRKPSLCSLAAESSYKTFQDPVQKTYSGDLLQKHSQHFTRDKPFTPKTLKSDKSSYLLKYRYYRSPQRKPTQDCSNSRLVQQETYRGSTKNKEYTQDFDEPSQECNTEHEWSEDDFNGTYLASSRQQSRAAKTRSCYSFDPSPRHSPGCRKSPTMMSVSAEEEELIYLEFISAVTEDILSRGHISDRVLDRVIKRHIDMNRHQLDEGKMRHLLEVLRKDFEKPINISTSSTELEEKENNLLDALLPPLESGGKQEKNKEDTDLFPYVSLIENCDSPHFAADPLLASTPLYSPEITTSMTKADEKDEEGDNEERGTGSPYLKVPVTDNAGINEEDFHQIDPAATNSVHTENQEYSTVGSDKEAEINYQANELEDLGRRLSESLHVSSNTPCENMERANEQHSDTVASSSDDEF